MYPVCAVDLLDFEPGFSRLCYDETCSDPSIASAPAFLPYFIRGILAL
jgi:hypothetical protein